MTKFIVWNILSSVNILTALRNAMWAQLWDLLHLDGETGRKWHAMMDEDWTLESVILYPDWNANGTNMLFKLCNETVSRRTVGAASYLRDNRRYIIADGEREQQEIFETQMARLGEDDIEVSIQIERDYDYEFFSLGSQRSLWGYKCRPRYTRHLG